MEQLLTPVIGFLLTIIGTVLVGQFKGMREDLHRITNSVQDLNQKLASVLTDMSWQKERLGILEKRLNELNKGDS